MMRTMLIIGVWLLAVLFFWALAAAGDGDQDEDDEKQFSGLLEEEDD